MVVVALTDQSGPEPLPSAPVMIVHWQIMEMPHFVIDTELSLLLNDNKVIAGIRTQT